MNTNRLKKFAQEARRKLLQQVSSRMELVLTTDSAELREKAVALNSLKDAIKNTSKEQIIDNVAYTWFNRLMALRFMDVNEYQPTGVKIVTPKDGYTLPEILEDARQGHIPDELPVNKEHIYDLLDGKIPSSNAQNEVYKELLIGACNQLHSVFPFLFEKIDDYTELLLPDDLTSEFSIIHEFIDGMVKEDCQEVEVIGWLYQFYISEKKDEVFASKSKVKKEDIPAATQLFTPRWIVEYMVQNTVGKLWLQNNPKSGLRDHMEYFIESPSVEAEDYLKIDSVEEITLLDQACGSGHILVYGFELLSKIYEEEGYNPSEIPQLIIEKNLFGFEIDERAAQLAGFALMMKARAYHRRVFRRDLKPNILQFKDVSFTKKELSKVLPKVFMDKSKEFQRDLELIESATNFGSLIQPVSSLKLLKVGLKEIENQLEKNSDIFLQDLLVRLKTAVIQLTNLARKYHCVVDNPPYMGSGAMNKNLLAYVKKHFPKSKKDLMACFMEAGLEALKPKGLLGMINQHSWMFLSSFEYLRKELLENILIDTLLHLGPRTFPEIGGEIVQNAAFTLTKINSTENGIYFRLVDYDKSEQKKEKYLEGLQNEKCEYRYTSQQLNYLKVPGTRIGYWLTKKALENFEKSELIGELGVARRGLQPGLPDLFKRRWFEIDQIKTQFGYQSRENSLNENKKWFLYNDGGTNIRWFGTLNYVIDWKNNGEGIKRIEKAIIPNEKLYLKEGITWSKISSGPIKARFLKQGIISGDAAPFFISDKPYLYIGYFNTIITSEILKLLSATTNLTTGNMGEIPFPNLTQFEEEKIEKLTKDAIGIAEEDWNQKEYSWDFSSNELISHKTNDIEKTLFNYKEYWELQFLKIHSIEEDLNRIFTEIYGMQEELNYKVPLEDITILKDEANVVNGQLIFDQKEIFSQFISYAVGCMFGRYSLDKEGLILANQGETLEEYLRKIGKREADVAFLPDDDNIIPVLDDEWFEDDIVGRFYEFLKASFGKENFDKNLAFVEECIGKDIRKYFVRDFYKDHIKRYKKRPIYWMFSSPKGSFNVLIYMHRYTPDTLNNILNGYLLEYREKLKARIEHLDHIIETGSSTEQTKAAKEKDRLRAILLELQEYEREILYPLATERISIDLDDGVLVNYNKFGKAIQEVKGLNDKKAKAKVKKFDWIDTDAII
ncbi:BREX-1 system adenine-specific DNA-methyltransferase PglX [Christiangramia sp.]|uniref:BREX-1 system adenine-specific DNA-methyltransferase PglX n=1 Tax=Christiangramia sp. TaxID=1931228 RepID=UPI00262623D8|nr:BREX-1 system adenine-specific DNA-methyltransferase PglX [Christiangramia sp.]